MNVKINIHPECSNISKRLELIDELDLIAPLKKELKQFLSDLGSGKVNKGVQVSERTQCKYVSLLRRALLYFNKPVNNITKKDLESFDNMLSKGLLKSEKKKPYSENTKKDIRIALVVLLRWKVGDTKAKQLTDFFDTRDIKKTPDYLSEMEIDKLFKSCRNSVERYIVAVLFDSGARAEELMNIRKEDYQLPENKDNYVKLTLKEEYSKTKGRVISLYWNKSLEAVRDYLQERISEGIKSDEPVLNLTYDAVRFFLKRVGIKALDKNIHLHLFRHSSATHYASKLNRQELCYRFGWAFSSTMPDTYISRAGMENKQLDEKFKSTELEELQKQLNKLSFDKEREKEDYERRFEKSEEQNNKMFKAIQGRNKSDQEFDIKFERSVEELEKKVKEFGMKLKS